MERSLFLLELLPAHEPSATPTASQELSVERFSVRRLGGHRFHQFWRSHVGQDGQGDRVADEDIQHVADDDDVIGRIGRARLREDKGVTRFAGNGEAILKPLEPRAAAFHTHGEGGGLRLFHSQGEGLVGDGEWRRRGGPGQQVQAYDEV